MNRVTLIQTTPPNRENDAVLAPQKGPQEAFCSSPADIAFYGGTAGSGKTWALALEYLRYYHIRQFHAVMFRREASQITKPGGLWDKSMEIFPKAGCTPRRYGALWEAPSKSTCSFSHMKDENDIYDWDGTEIPYIAFDELTHFTERQFFYLLRSSRSVSGVLPYVRATMNANANSWVAKFIQWWWDRETGYPIPERSGVIKWFYRVKDETRWYDTRDEAIADNPDIYNPPGIDVTIEPKSFTFISAYITDNPTLLRVNPEYLGNLYALQQIDRERLLNNNWKIIPTAGNVFNRSWFEFVPAAPAGGRVVRYWDKAATAGGGDHTAGVRIKEYNGLYFVEDVTYGQWSSFTREKTIQNVASQDGKDVPIYLEQEPGSSGKDSAQYTIRDLAGYKAYADPVSGSKLERAKPFSAQCEAGNVKIVRGDWNEFYLDRLHNFSGEDGDDDDVVDASSGAFNKLQTRQRPIQQVKIKGV